MEGVPQETGLQGGLLAILRAVTEGTLVLFLKNLLDAWEVWTQLRDRARYHGMYEILDYRSTLDLLDATGEKAIISRRQVIRFLQDNIVAIHDHAWGDGKLFAKYKCRPGVPVDFYQDGSKHNVLISLRETKNRGDVMEFSAERTIAGGFLKQNEWLETEVDHLTTHLRLAIIFPKARPCLRATLTRKTVGKTEVLDERHFKTLGSGRQELSLAISRPKLHECYLVKWDW
jgi:hypothetical protein